MPNYIDQFNECTDPVPGDWLWSVDVSAGATDKDRKLDIGRLALLAFANIFTANQRINALVGINAAPSSSAQLLTVANAAAVVALRAKAAASPSVPVFDLLDSGDVARHRSWVSYGTSIPAARTMSGYQEFSIQPGNITTQTLTVDIVGGTFPRQPVYMEVIGTFYNNSDGTTVRALWVDDVTFSTRLNASTNATIGVNTRRVTDINAVTVTGPTAINAGVRYTVVGSANLVRTGMLLRVFSANDVTVTASVA
jgi:hypothetical protein